jgi:truncated hemoglobin YjbI
MVDSFYYAVRKDNILGPVFEIVLPSNWEEHIYVITEFWSTILLGSHSFQGNILAKHMSHDSSSTSSRAILPRHDNYRRVAMTTKISFC